MNSIRTLLQSSLLRYQCQATWAITLMKPFQTSLMANKTSCELSQHLGRHFGCNFVKISELKFIKFIATISNFIIFNRFFYEFWNLVSSRRQMGCIKYFSWKNSNNFYNKFLKFYWQFLIFFFNFSVETIHYTICKYLR